MRHVEGSWLKNPFGLRGLANPLLPSWEILCPYSRGAIGNWLEFAQA